MSPLQRHDSVFFRKGNIVVIWRRILNQPNKPNNAFKFFKFFSFNFALGSHFFVASKSTPRTNPPVWVVVANIAGVITSPTPHWLINQQQHVSISLGASIIISTDCGGSIPFFLFPKSCWREVLPRLCPPSVQGCVGTFPEWAQSLGCEPQVGDGAQDEPRWNLCIEVSLLARASGEWKNLVSRVSRTRYYLLSISWEKHRETIHKSSDIITSPHSHPSLYYYRTSYDGSNKQHWLSCYKDGSLERFLIKDVIKGSEMSDATINANVRQSVDHLIQHFEKRSAS